MAALLHKSSIKKQLLSIQMKLTRKDFAKNSVMPVLIIVICLIAFWLATNFDRVPPILKRGIQPSDFPQLVLGLIVILCLFDIFTNKSDAPKNLTPLTWLTIAAIAGFVLLAKLDMFFGLGVFSVTLAALWGERRVLTLACLGIVLPLTVFFLFDLVFEIRFPRGFLTSLWYG